MHSTSRIWPQVIRPLGEVEGKNYKATIFDDGSLEYWFDLTDLEEDSTPTIPNMREFTAWDETHET